MTELFNLFQNANDPITDLIELDSSLSFEVDDFDPLNQNARQLPPVPKRSSVVLPTIPSSLPPPKIDSINNPIYPYHQSRAQAFSNPVYPYHQPSIAQPPNQPFRRSTDPSTMPMSNYKDDDETELLRKYGLDRLNLVDAKIQDKSCLNGNTGPIPFAFSNSNNRNLNSTMDPFRDGKNTIGLETNSDIEPKTNNIWTTFD